MQKLILEKKGYKIGDVRNLMRRYEKHNLDFLKLEKQRDLTENERKESNMILATWDQLNTLYQKLKAEKI